VARVGAGQLAGNRCCEFDDGLRHRGREGDSRGRWLSGFAYHAGLRWWMFVVASRGALLTSLANVAWQACIAARAKPALALRYE